ncbi:hypothetical protein EK21DRAFT_52546, partial [Setomelanomma holmii]
MVNADQIYSQTRWILNSADADLSDSDSDSETGIGNEPGGFQTFVKDIKTHLDCLLDLSSALDCPAVDTNTPDEPSILKVEQRAAHDYHADLILAKFPKAHIDLAQCLGKTSWQRYQRMQQEREHNANGNTTSPAQEQAMASDAKSSLAISEFQDSGLGSSLPSAPPTRYAETVISFMTSITGGNRVQIPPLPAEAKIGAPFECNACGRQVRAFNNREWRKHLYLDLQPYTCFFVGCSFSATPFADRNVWSNHLELDHKFGPKWDSIECPLCLERTDAVKSKILIHFARHMEDIALAALPREVESEGESDGESDGSLDTIRSALKLDKD